MRQVLPLLTLGIAVVALAGTARAWAEEAAPHDAVVEMLMALYRSAETGS